MLFITPVTTLITHLHIRLSVSTLVPKMPINLHAILHVKLQARHLCALESTLGVMNGARYPAAGKVESDCTFREPLRAGATTHERRFFLT